MTNQVSITINDQSITVDQDSTILTAARQLGIDIPTICYHDHCTANGLCRICAVEVEGARTLIPACATKVTAGMKIKTNTERVRSARKTILEMLASTVDLTEAPDILDLIQEYGAQTDAFPGSQKREVPLIVDNPMYIRDYAKCILCWRCVQVCAYDAQFTFAINFDKRGYETQIGTFYDQGLMNTTCVFCGQCVAVCPTGALKPVRQWLLEEGHEPDEIMEMTRAIRKENMYTQETHASRTEHRRSK